MKGFNGFSFSNNSPSSSSSSSGSSSANQQNHEATIKKIVEAVETLEKLAKAGQFPQEKLQEIKQELKKKYPNIVFSSENNSQKPNNNNNNNNNQYRPSQNNSTFPNNNIFPNTSSTIFSNDYYTNLLNQQQKIFQESQLQYTKLLEQNMRMMGMPWTNPNYNNNFSYPSYPTTTPSTNYGQMSGDPMKMFMDQIMMGNTNYNPDPTGGADPLKMFFDQMTANTNYNPDPTGGADPLKMFVDQMTANTNYNLDPTGGAAAFGSFDGFGSDGSSALSFLGSLLGGFGM